VQSQFRRKWYGLFFSYYYKSQSFAGYYRYYIVIMPVLTANKWLIVHTFPPFFSHNKIGELDSSSLAGLNRLTWLDLSNNRINLIQELRRPPKWFL
jgi:hypothetical protein